MKRLIFVIAALFVIASLGAQTDEVLTNSSIVKMTKAKLTDELIIDVIQSSQVSFNLDHDALAGLKSEGVSELVIDAMKAAAQMKANQPGNSTTQAASRVATEPAVKQATKEEPKPVNSGMPSSTEFAPEAIDALGYVAPVKDLVQFFEDEFSSMDKTVSEWDKSIRSSLEDLNEINTKMEKVETEMNTKKNADAKGYSSEIQALKKKLSENRTQYKQLKSKMLSDGEGFSQKLTSLSEEQVKALGKKYDEVCSGIKSIDASPALGENPVKVSFETLKMNDGLQKYLVPTGELFHWYQNQILDLRRVIAEWNVKVKEAVAKDALLKKQLDPLEKQMETYKQNAKQNKNEISALKKQISDVEKERKALAGRMEDESKQLADYLEKSGETIQNTIKERFTDIIENINFLYHEKLNV